MDAVCPLRRGNPAGQGLVPKGVKHKVNTRGALKVGDEVLRIDIGSLSHGMRGTVTAVDGQRATVAWASGKTTKVSLAREGLGWERAR